MMLLLFAFLCIFGGLFFSPLKSKGPFLFWGVTIQPKEVFIFVPSPEQFSCIWLHLKRLNRVEGGGGGGGGEGRVASR